MSLDRCERTIQDLINDIKQYQNRQRKCRVLIGAGCSVTAGIPLCDGFIKLIESKYGTGYALACKEAVDAKAPTYFECMAALYPKDRQELIREVINSAKMNWAHAALAQLIKSRWIDWVMTTNFDPLVVKACSRAGIYPGVYDIASSSDLKPEYIADQAVIHLHGQHTGWVMVNTLEEIQREALKNRVKRILDESLAESLLIVVGCSGWKDPVFEALSDHGRFDRGLYWVTFKDADPPNSVAEKILGRDKYSFYIRGFDSDKFFITLARELGLFPPDFIKKPFTYLTYLMDDFGESTIEGETDILAPARQRIIEAETGEKLASRVKDTTIHYLSGKYQEVIESLAGIDDLTQSEKDLLYWSHNSLGGKFANAAEQHGDTQDNLQKAISHFEQASLLKTDNHEALTNCGLALSNRAETKRGGEADKLWALAYEKYGQALKIEPDMHGALSNWGCALDGQARTKQGEEADKLWVLAFEKFEQAVKIKPDMHEALYNWGRALDNQARTKQGEEADKLWALAYEKYEQALEIKPDYYMALNNWGNALSNQAENKQGEEADKLRILACEKYEQALKIKPDMHGALYNWGNILSNQAERKQGEEADKLWVLAYEKYEQALEIKPDYYAALNNWGAALYAQARTKQDKAANELLALAYAKYAEAVKIKPDYHAAINNWAVALISQGKHNPDRSELLSQALDILLRGEAVERGSCAYNLACLYAVQNNVEKAIEWLRLAKETGSELDEKTIAEDSDFDAVRDGTTFKEFISSLPSEKAN